VSAFTVADGVDAARASGWKHGATRPSIGASGRHAQLTAHTGQAKLPAQRRGLSPNRVLIGLQGLQLANRHLQTAPTKPPNALPSLIRCSFRISPPAVGARGWTRLQTAPTNLCVLVSAASGRLQAVNRIQRVKLGRHRHPAQWCVVAPCGFALGFGLSHRPPVGHKQRQCHPHGFCAPW
jgi:hypothetical protein